GVGVAGGGARRGVAVAAASVPAWVMSRRRPELTCPPPSPPTPTVEGGCAYCLVNSPPAKQERDIPSTQLRRPVRGCSIAIAAPRLTEGYHHRRPRRPLRFGRASIGGPPPRVN